MGDWRVSDLWMELVKDPGQSEIRWRLGEMLLQSATETARDRHSSGNGRTHLDLGQRIQLAEAFLLLWDAAYQLKSLERWLEIGTRFRKAGWLDPALIAYRQACRLAPNDFEAITGLGATLVFSGMPLEGIPFLEQATGPGVLASDKRGRAFALNALSRGLQAVGRMDEAAKYGEEAAELFGTHAAYMGAGRVLKENGYPGGALRMYTKALALTFEEGSTKERILQEIESLKHEVAASAPAPDNTCNTSEAFTLADLLEDQAGEEVASASPSAPQEDILNAVLEHNARSNSEMLGRLDSMTQALTNLVALLAHREETGLQPNPADQEL